MQIRLTWLVIAWQLLIVASCTQTEQLPQPVRSYPLWQPITFAFEGPASHENAIPNPFLDYRLQLTFMLDGDTLVVPGYFAADGNPAETSAQAGSIWQVKFTPPKTGDWQYQISFRQGQNLAVSLDAEEGEALSLDGKKGSFTVVEPDSIYSLSGF